MDMNEVVFHFSLGWADLISINGVWFYGIKGRDEQYGVVGPNAPIGDGRRMAGSKEEIAPKPKNEHVMDKKQAGLKMEKNGGKNQINPKNTSGVCDNAPKTFAGVVGGNVNRNNTQTGGGLGRNMNTTAKQSSGGGGNGQTYASFLANADIAEGWADDGMGADHFLRLSQHDFTPFFCMITAVFQVQGWDQPGMLELYAG
nr:hypothetical protein Iba_chr14cCG14830 [Ipomoea batatas]